MKNVLKHTLTLGRWCLAVVLTGCAPPGKPDPADRPVPADQVVEFNALFQTNCAGCHGAEGKLGPAPPLNDPIFLSIVPDAELLRVISEGRPGTPMAAFARERGGVLTDEQVKALAAGLKPRWKSPVELELSPPSYLASTRDDVSADDLQLGAKAFSRACSICHGEHGQGTTRAGAIYDPAFLGLISDRALRRIIITGRPDLGMPNFADDKARGKDYQPLSANEIDALVALLGQWRQSTPSVAPNGERVPNSQLSIDNQGSKP
jgi:cytochrome c oxidase cbb3-type subunit 3